MLTGDAGFHITLDSDAHESALSGKSYCTSVSIKGGCLALHIVITSTQNSKALKATCKLILLRTT